MEKPKNSPMKNLSRIAVLGSLIVGIVIGSILSAAIFKPLPPIAEYLIVTTTPQAFGAPQTNRTFISSQESATPSLPVGDEYVEEEGVLSEEQFIENTPMCSNITLGEKGHYVFRIWLQQSMELYRLDEGGENLCRLTDNDVNDNQPKWSPDGNKIAFVSSLDGYGIYIMDVDGSNIQRVTTGGSAYSYPSWSPDGDMLIFQATIDEQFDIYRINLDGTDLQNLTNQERLDTMPVWSPDGSYIAFASDRIFNPYTNLNLQPQERSYDIYMMNANGLNARRLTVTDSPETYPSWSPDSQEIAYVDNYRINLMNKDGSNIREIEAGENPVWMPDGQYISFVRHGVIYRVNVDGDDIHQVSNFELPLGSSGIRHMDFTGSISP